MKTEDYVTRQFEAAKAINRQLGYPAIRYSVDLDQFVAWDWDETDEDDYGEESFP